MDNWAKGIDLGGDGLIDPEKVLAAGYSFVIHRVIRTNGLVDEDFHENARRCSEAGITFGTYFWPGPGHAERFLEACPPNSAWLPPAIDLENNPGGLSMEQYWEEAHAELVLIEQSWNPESSNARRTMIYGNRSFLTEMLPQDDPNVGAHPLWFAHPGSEPGPIPPQWDDFAFWQCGFGEDSTGAIVPGCPGRVDWNRYAGTHDELVERFGLVAG